MSPAGACMGALGADPGLLHSAFVAELVHWNMALLEQSLQQCSTNATARVAISSKDCGMFGWAVTFLLVAIVAALFGFGGLAGTAAWMAKILFIVGLALFLVFLVMGRRPPF